jgi:hypothetical protein
MRKGTGALMINTKTGGEVPDKKTRFSQFLSQGPVEPLKTRRCK